MRYDVAIIGGGPGGYTAAHKAAKNGLKTILFEKDKLGGTCLNRGCIPTKALIEAAHLYKKGREAELYGLHFDASFDYAKINERRDEVVAKLRSGVEKMLKADKVEVVYGAAKLIEKDKVLCNEEVYEADHIILAAGSVPSRAPIEGVELTISSDRILEGESEFIDSLIVIGGGVIGSEISDALNCLGTKVTIIEMADRLIPTMDKDLGQRLGMFFKKKGIDVYLSSAVKKIEEEDGEKKVTFTDKSGKEVFLKAKEVLLATGRKAAVEGLVDEAVGLEMKRGVLCDENGRTNIENVYCIGDAISGNIQLAHVAESQGKNIIDLILGKKPHIDMSVIPSGIYTEPEIASVGRSEEELKASSISYASRKALTGANGRCLIENAESGFVKLLIVDDVIVGGSIVAPHATELIAELALAVEKKMTAEQLSEVIHPHPTISELLRDASEA